MNEKEIILLWQSENEKSEGSLTINKKYSDAITGLKIQNFLTGMKPVKIFAILMGISWVALLGTFLVFLSINAYGKVSMFFLCSAAVQVILTAIAVGFYVYQVNLIRKIDFNEAILSIQEKHSRLTASTLNVTRILVLQLPLWTTFYWNKEMFASGNLFLWLIQGIITLSFTCLAIWLFFNIKYENKNKKWFQWLFKGREWQPILQSVELLNQIQQYGEEGNEESKP
jgi:hypothetical protein